VDLDVARLPKAELHCHIDGMIDPPMLAELARRGHSPPLGADELAAVLPVTSVESFESGYGALVGRLEPCDVWLPRVLQVHIDRLRAQRVVYTEIFVSGLLAVRDDPGALVEYFHELRAHIDAAAGDELAVELVLCFGRGPVDKLERKAARILALRRAGLIRGVALAGLDEARWPVRPARHLFDAFRDAGLGIEIHAGELAGPESVRDALEHGRPDRIGHGLAAFDDPALLDEIARRGIHLELCPTSNLRLGRVARLEDHPVGRARDLGLSFSINTDDPGAFAITLTEELAQVGRTFAFTEADYARMFEATMRASFAGR
jgi:adenosine deaminase